ncbi:MAG TPA: toll/interleukin-1 receptor domain-containing protein, partial [Burkholderiaceae bacterium]|nr:toll/interleukin-1 receptor domain-containing protein [Burkholderiaceae bacterium]
MGTAQIFISYRRDDAAGYARAIYDELARRFGAERVFIDVDDIPAGQAFDEAIRSAVGRSQVLLVLIGKRWLGERDGAAPPRISEADDFVRIEVAAGLAQGMRVIPLLLDGATMPTAEQLPETLQPLTRRHALELGNTRFAADMERLVTALRSALGERRATDSQPAAAPPSIATPRRLALLGALLAAIFALGGAWWLAQRQADDPGRVAARTAAPARPAINGAWQADVTYDWPNARYTERFDFSGEGDTLLGSASFLGAPRGIFEGQLATGELRFVTRTLATGGAGGSRETVHRYRGKHIGD